MNREQEGQKYQGHSREEYRAGGSRSIRRNIEQEGALQSMENR